MQASHEEKGADFVHHWRRGGTSFVSGRWLIYTLLSQILASTKTHELVHACLEASSVCSVSVAEEEIHLSDCFNALCLQSSDGDNVCKAR